MVLGVWDTAGSERYEAMSKMYYRNAKVHIQSVFLYILIIIQAYFI